MRWHTDKCKSCFNFGAILYTLMMSDKSIGITYNISYYMPMDKSYNRMWNRTQHASNWHQLIG